MTLATNALATFEAKGNREDLSDAIYRIDPTDTPFYSGIEREKATATFHEWQTQALAAAAANAQLEGDDNVSANARTPTTRLGNYLQISTKIVRVTGTQRVVQHAGREDELDYQVMLGGLELKRDVEFVLMSNQARNAGADATARNLGSITSWIFTNINKNGGTNPTAGDGTQSRSDGTTRAFTEAQLKDVIQQIYVSGGKPDVVMLGAFNKQQLSTFTGRGTPIQDQTDRKITAAVDVYESDFGRMKVVPNRQMRKIDCYVLQMDMWAYASLSSRNFVSFPLAKTGDTDRKQILSEYTLVARNEKSSGAVYDLTTA